MLGVSIALWADNWVSERSDREQEIVRLEALALNVDATIVAFDDAIGNAAGAKEALQKIAQLTENELAGDELLDLLFYGLLYDPSFTPELNVYDDLKHSGELALLTNADVRQSLARLDVQLGLMHLSHADLGNVQTNNIDLYLVDNLDLQAIYRNGLGTKSRQSTPPFEHDIQNDVLLRNRALLKLDIVIWLEVTYRDVQEQLPGVNAAIEAQLQSDD